VASSFSVPVQIGPGAHPASHTMGTGSLSPGFHPPYPRAATWRNRVSSFYSTGWNSLQNWARVLMYIELEIYTTGR